MDFAKNGDKLCLNIVDNTCHILGKVLANVATIINPSKIIIGGGVSRSGEFFLQRIRLAFKHYAIPRLEENCEIKEAYLGNDAGIIGSAYMVKEYFER